MLQLIIGGTIRNKAAENAYVLTITSINGLLAIINLINGKLRTPKVAQFNKMVRWINTDSKLDIPIYGADDSDILGNAWLSGFIDADGSFDIRLSLITNGAAKNRVSARMRLEQRMTDPVTNEPYFDVMNLIATALGVTLSTSLHNQGVKYYLIGATSAKARATIASYFAQFPLFSSKLLNYQDWLVCHNMIVAGQHTTDFGRSEAMRLKLGMNSKRTYYN